MNLTQYVKYASFAQNYIAVGLNTNQRILVQSDIFNCKERFDKNAHAEHTSVFSHMLAQGTYRGALTDG